MSFMNGSDLTMFIAFAYFMSFSTLARIILLNTQPAYNNIPNLPVNPPYQDDGVNHSVTFVSPTGCTTNQAEVNFHSSNTVSS